MNWDESISPGRSLWTHDRPIDEHWRATGSTERPRLNQKAVLLMTAQWLGDSYGLLRAEIAEAQGRLIALYTIESDESTY